jgi:hypothetical protein
VCLQRLPDFGNESYNVRIYQYGASNYVTLTLRVFVLAGVIAAQETLSISHYCFVLQVISTGLHMVLVGMSREFFL